MEERYFVHLDLNHCEAVVEAAVTDSVTGERIDRYELTHPQGGAVRGAGV